MNQHPAEQDSTRYWEQPVTPTIDCSLLDDAIDEYTLGIADPSQRVVIERHLGRCMRCSTLVASYQNTVAVLALAVPLVTPPVSARTTLMSRVAATPQRASMPANVFSGSLESLKTPTLPSSTAVIPLRSAQSMSPSPWWRVYAAPLATLPLLLALGLVGAWGFNNYARLNDANDVIAMQDQAIQSMDDQLGLDEQEVVQLAFSPSSKRYTMTSDSTSGGGLLYGTLIADPATGQAALQVEGLNAGYYSVLVQTQDGEMVQKAVFQVGEDGTASTAVDLGEQVTDFQSVHIRSSNSFIETDVAVDGEIQDVLMAVIGPDINQNSGTGVEGR